jgi:hypothetical protein
MYLKFILSVSILCIINTNAYAYLDPGTGTIIIQAIVGAIAAGAVTIKIYWYKLKAFFKKKKDKKF